MTLTFEDVSLVYNFFRPAVAKQNDVEFEILFSKKSTARQLTSEKHEMCCNTVLITRFITDSKQEINRYYISKSSVTKWQTKVVQRIIKYNKMKHE